MDILIALLAINGVAPNSNVNTRRLEAALARRLQFDVGLVIPSATRTANSRVRLLLAR